MFGNSAGGPSAIQFAIRHPERCYALVLVASTVPGDVPLPPKPIMRAIFGSDFVYYSICTLFKKKMISMVGVSETMQEQLLRPCTVLPQKRIHGTQVRQLERYGPFTYEPQTGTVVTPWKRNKH